MRKKDEGFTNIRIREETREELRKQGTYNESMDDIVLKCVNAYKELNNQDKLNRLDELTKRFEELEQYIGRGRKPEKPQQPQSQHFRIFESDTIKPEPGERLIHGGHSVEAEIDLPGIKFPINKIELVDFAKHLDDIFEYNKMAVDGFYYDLFRNLEDKTYTDKQSLEEALVVLLNNTKKDFFGKKNMVVGIKMITTKEEMEKRMQQREQQENQQLSK